MSWLTRVRNAISLVIPNKAESPDNLWHKCKGCGQMVFVKELQENQSVCPICDHHERIGARARFDQLFDPGYTLLANPKVAEDPLKFRDSKKYVDRLKAARAANVGNDALTNALGKIGGHKAVLGVQDFAFMGGSMGSVVGEKFVRGIQAAIKAKATFICVSASGGARMQEGLLSLMQMAKTSAALTKLSEAKLPYFSVLTDPTMGGVSASLAMLGDLNIGEPKALIGFAGPRVIEQTVREKLPEGFQRSEFLLEHGAIDMIVDRRQMRDTIARLVAKFMRWPAPAKEHRVA